MYEAKIQTFTVKEILKALKKQYPGMTAPGNVWKITCGCQTLFNSSFGDEVKIQSYSFEKNPRK